MDVWLGKISVMLSPECKMRSKLKIRKSISGFLMKKKERLRQCGDRDFQAVGPQRNPRLFTVAAEKKLTACEHVRDVLRFFLHSAAGKKAKALYTKQEKVPLPSSFDFHGYWQHRGSRLNGSHRWRYYDGFISRDVQLIDRIEFGFENSLTARIATEAD